MIDDTTIHCVWTIAISQEDEKAFILRLAHHMINGTIPYPLAFLHELLDKYRYDWEAIDLHVDRYVLLRCQEYIKNLNWNDWEANTFLPSIRERLFDEGIGLTNKQRGVLERIVVKLKSSGVWEP